MKPSRAAGGDRLFPGAGGEEGEKEWKLAEFYRRNGHPGLAYFYYQVLRRRYPASPHAKEATERMKELRRVLEKAVDETDQEPGATR